MRFRGSLAILAAIMGALYAGGAVAQEAFDPKALDATVSAAKPKGKKAKAEVVAPQKKPGKTQDRQFGELEGWSPGKNPPKKDKDEPASAAAPAKNAPMSVSPSGNMSVGLPF